MMKFAFAFTWIYFFKKLQGLKPNDPYLQGPKAYLSLNSTTKFKVY